MQTPIETLRGTPYEMGQQAGAAYKHLIHGDVRQWALRHDFQGSDAYLDEKQAPARKANAEIAPWIEEELRGMADGSGVELAWLHRLNLRVWEVPFLEPNAASGAKPTTADTCGCTAIGMRTPDDGVVIGGNLDDARMPYVLIRRLPKDGLAHVTAARAGGIWNQNGFNEAGLFMGSNGTGFHTDFKDPHPAPRVPSGTVNRLILQTCRTVAEALQLIQKSHTSKSFVLGDAQGNLAAVQVMGSLFDVQYASEKVDMVFCTNHFYLPGIVQPLAEQRCEPYMAEKSRVRFEVLEAWRRTPARSAGALQSLLRSHDGFPNSICNHLTAYSLMAAPQKRPGYLSIADRHPCRGEYFEVPVRS